MKSNVKTKHPINTDEMKKIIDAMEAGEKVLAEIPERVFKIKIVEV